MTKYSFRVKKSINETKEYLIDPKKFVSVHPLIYKMNYLGDNKYKVFEQVKFGIVPYRFTYTAVITHDLSSVSIEATIMKLTKILMHFTFSEAQGGTLIEERVIIKSPLPIQGFMQNLIFKQHQLMFNNVEIE